MIGPSKSARATTNTNLRGEPIAVVGMGCRYPDARSPEELWHAVMAQRRGFRRIPDVRLPLGDYGSDDPRAADLTYVTQAAVLSDWQFDRVRFRVTGPTYRTTDPAHWLALDVADQALQDAGMDDLPRQRTGVIMGNTLTGESTRASTLRLRWPYVRRVVGTMLDDLGAAQRDAFLDVLEHRFKAAFAPLTEDSLAGGLANTIAGRICNHFDLGGGGYIVDGACASSLLAVATACRVLHAGDVDVALAGGVDLSLDPFELTGFARTGALARDMMYVYDERSAGFWPGEGCGVVVLMRLADAVAQGRRVHAVIRGWGVSSDGQGGITRPEASGQMRAIEQAYVRAGVGIDTVALFEGHGTGTSVGDATELSALSQALRQAQANTGPAAIDSGIGPAIGSAIGSIKANFGHTKAAAGMAGLIKVIMALRARVLPPTTGCTRPHPELCTTPPVLRVLARAEPWPKTQPQRAAVSAMGFGGINTHIVVDGPATKRETPVWPWTSAAQNAELFVLSAADRPALEARIEDILVYAAQLSLAELTDLAAALARQPHTGPWRAAVVASNPAELARGLQALPNQQTVPGVYMGQVRPRCRVAFLFPGQGSPVRLHGNAWSHRFAPVRALYTGLPDQGDARSTAIAQPAIAVASLAGLSVLHELGVHADIAVGHSLGELAALHWAGAIDHRTLMEILQIRGQVMEESSAEGAMASISAPRDQVQVLLAAVHGTGPVVIAGHNAPDQIAVAGTTAAIDAVLERARAHDFLATKLAVTRAFHSPLMEPIVPGFRNALAQMHVALLKRPIVSTVTGGTLSAHDDIRELLARQVAEPVRFVDALDALGPVDLGVEVGPGRVLAGLAARHPKLRTAHITALDVGGASFEGLLATVGAAFVLGASVRPAALFDDRFCRPFDLRWRPAFLENPCESTRARTSADTPPSLAALAATSWTPAFAGKAENPALSGAAVHDIDADPTQPDASINLVRRLIADRAELPVDTVLAHHRLLGDLHLNSIAVAELVVASARALHRVVPAAPTAFADATVADLAEALESLPLAGHDDEPEALPAGVEPWIRSFVIHLEPAEPGMAPSGHEHGQHDDHDDHDNHREQNAWQIVAPANHGLRRQIERALHDVSPGGVVVCLPEQPDIDDMAVLLRAAQDLVAACGSCAAEKELRYFVVIQHGRGAASFARSLAHEAPHLRVRVIDIPVARDDIANRIAADIATREPYAEIAYTDDGARQRPVLQHRWLHGGPLPLGRDDHLLVTGGGKGIAAECALALARETGVQLTLLGRSDPDEDPMLAETLRRFAGVRMRYTRADVTDADAVRAAVAEAVQHSGRPITALLHGAGLNQPRLVCELDVDALRATLAPKLDGARNVLAALDLHALRVFIAFGSVIARIGLRGEAHYAVANEWLAHLVDDFKADHPDCLCACVEWSVWSGTGMGERLGRIDSLLRAGITPISVDQGTRMLRRILASLVRDSDMPTAVIVSGRLGRPATLLWPEIELPLLRFLERPRVHIPGVELVVDVRLSADTDLYLSDHRLDKTLLLPAVFGLEAMAQVAMTLAGNNAPPEFVQVRFERPIAMLPGQATTLRIAALSRDHDRIDVVIRSSESDFQADHFHATCRFGERDRSAPARSNSDQGDRNRRDRDKRETTLLDDLSEHIYGPGRLLFHGPRFQRIRRYLDLAARSCTVEIEAGPSPWFSDFLPQTLVLGDPGARDARIHAIQACIPHRRLLPLAVERLWIAPASGLLRVHAVEREHHGDEYVYDIETRDASDRVVERWHGLRLRAVAPIDVFYDRAPALLGPCIERNVHELTTARVVTVVEHGGDRGERGARAATRLGNVTIHRRADGKPEISSPDAHISFAHTDALTLAVAARGPLGCDIEPVVHRDMDAWRDLLGAERLALAERLAGECAEVFDIAATRVWSAMECLIKAGQGPGAPLLVGAIERQWCTLRAGPLAVVTGVLPAHGQAPALVVAVLAQPHTHGTPESGATDDS